MPPQPRRRTTSSSNNNNTHTHHLLTTTAAHKNVTTAAAHFLDTWRVQAHYEIHVDVYRGMRRIVVCDSGSSSDEAASVAAAEGEDDSVVVEAAASSPVPPAAPTRSTTTHHHHENDNDSTVTTTTTSHDCSTETTTAAPLPKSSDATLPAAAATSPIQRLSPPSPRSSTTTAICWDATTTTAPQDVDNDNATCAAMPRTAAVSLLGPWMAQCTPLGTTTGCPTVAAWPQQQRPPTRAGRWCACDYNPFCLPSTWCTVAATVAWGDTTATTTTDHHNNEATAQDTVDDTTADVIVVDANGKKDDDDETFDVMSLLSPVTLELYRETRRSERVDPMVVQEYWKDLFGQDSQQTTEALLAWVQEYHASMVFSKPTLTGAGGAAKQRDSADTVLTLATPPGMENLGATCYLNTQLQCLAQNLVFVKGILSWEKQKHTAFAEHDDRMSTVLALFQSLFVRMRAGPYQSVNTIEFSNALGLDHHEQQDPNEFSGLLLDKMHQAFRNTSHTSASTKKDDTISLGDLIPLQFQGTCSFTTVCQTCKSSSGPTETFMDLKIPIAKRPVPPEPRKQPAAKKPIATSILEQVCAAVPKAKKGAKRKAVVERTDLEFCFQMICQEEHLVGDNQYFCSHCNRKCDAIRSLKLRQLPPVLNLQLVRYVWTPQMVKQKVTTSVQLPDVLTIEKKRYRLCAIMSHRGTSAYSGHYVAEAMDWMTGQWYSFNDMEVSLLIDGPVSLYSAMSETDRKTCQGSADAYNLYYVEEEFLAQSLMDGSTSKQCNPKLETMASDRSSHYARVAALWLEDGKAAQRLKERRSRILETLIPKWPPSRHDYLDSVWVDSAVWLRFMSCTDRLEDVLSQSPLLEHKSYLCAHKKLHPVRARGGKLLPRAMYDAYVEALLQEQRELNGMCSEVADIQISPANDNMFCDECSHNYRSSLEQSLRLVENIQTLHEHLGENQFIKNLEVDPGVTFGNDCDKYAYVVERKFATAFRKGVTNLIKRIFDEANQGKNTLTKLDGMVPFESLAEGLGVLDVERFLHDDKSSQFRKVNAGISCRHGRLTTVQKNRIRYTKLSTWCLIRDLFPEAIELKRPRIWQTPIAETKLDENAAKENSPDRPTPFVSAEILFDSYLCPSCQGADLAPLDQPASDVDAAVATNTSTCEVIAIDTDTEEPPQSSSKESSLSFFQLRVFQVEEKASSDSIQAALVTCCNGTHPADESAGTFPVRRSARQRKTIYPVGVIEDEDTVRANVNCNVAALRLLLLQSCQGSRPFEIQHSLLLAISVRKKRDIFSMMMPRESSLFQFVDLSFEMNDRQLRDVCEQTMGQTFGPDFDPAESVILLRLGDNDVFGDGMLGKEELFDHLIAVANADDGKPAKKRRTERGFTGTFLSSSIPAPTADVATETGDEKKCAEAKDDAVSASQSAEGDSKPPAQLKNGGTIAVNDLTANGKSGKANGEVPTVTESSTTVNRRLRKEDFWMAEDDCPASPPIKRKRLHNRNGQSSTTSHHFGDKAAAINGLNDTSSSESEDDTAVARLMSGGLSTERERIAATRKTVLEILQSNVDLRPFNDEMGVMAVEAAMDAEKNHRNTEEIVNKAYSYYLEFTVGGTS